MRTLLIACILLALAAGGGYWFLSAQEVSAQKESRLEDAKAGAVADDAAEQAADLAVEGFELTHGQGGKAEWELVADRGLYRQDSGVVDVERPTVTYYLDEGNGTVVAAAEKGEVEQNSSRARLWPDVHISFHTTTITAEALDYAAERRELDLSGNVSLRGEGWTSTANFMTVDLKSGVITASDGVTAILQPSATKGD